jgi:peptidoglycan/LPS O-acetylase OafA/YrhL
MLACVTSFIISLNLTVIYKFTKTNIIIIVVTVLISLPIALVCYDLIGKYFEKQSKQKSK